MKECLTCGADFSGEAWLCPKCGRAPDKSHGFLSFAPGLSHTNEGFPADAHERLFHSEQYHFWFNSRNKIILWSLAKYFANAATFFEIGCGTGFVLQGVHSTFPQIELHGSEIEERGLEFAAKRVPATNLYQMDARHLPFRDHFDVVGVFDVLEHVDDDLAVLREMFKAAKKSTGGIIITVPQHDFLWSVVDDFSCHVRRYSRSELRRKVEAAGFRVLKVTSFMSLTLPIFALSRLQQRNVSMENFDPLTEFRVSKKLNAFLEGVLSLERAAVKSGVSLPLGSSLLMVAKVAR